jgi:GTP cyclohydrolase I
MPKVTVPSPARSSRRSSWLTEQPEAQERLTKQVAECLAALLRAQGVGVVLEAEHSCMTLRGVRAHGAKTVTSTLLGTLRADARSRAEFFALAGVPR